MELYFSISPFSEYSGLISFKIDWFDLLAVQGLSRVISNITVQKHQFFCLPLMVQLSCSYMTTRKTIALTICTFAGKVMSLLFNTLSRFVIAFFPMHSSSFQTLCQRSPKLVAYQKIYQAVSQNTASWAHSHTHTGPRGNLLGTLDISGTRSVSLASGQLPFSNFWRKTVTTLSPTALCINLV